MNKIVTKQNNVINVKK